MPARGQVDKDLIGKKIGCYTVLDDYIRRTVTTGTKILWRCRCDCGNELYVYRDSLLKSKHEWCPKCRPDGVRNENLYHIYYGIKQRCYNPKATGFEIYGGKGVKMCDEWLAEYKNFRVWSIRHGYKPNVGLSIDRIDSNGDYCPENCRWVSIGENSARANYGRQKNHSELIEPYAISPFGERVDIKNISKFSRDNSLNRSNVSAALHGRISPYYHGWFFYSNKIRQEKCNDYRKHNEGEKPSGRSE